ncbi:hypothetical protein [Halopseudomonas sabulinigri]|uniref:Uncharacterized protein n=1 Tax=Halopseudomonas sabulinigri TaxID=472181 RepID=A0ABP9ZN22_9GAMM
MKKGLLLSLLALALSAQAQPEEDKVYLLAAVNVTDTSVAQSIFLHEPDITDLSGCREAVQQGKRNRDWMSYHHIQRKDRAQGFTFQFQYHCVTSAQTIEPWYDRARYDHVYLLRVDEESKLTVKAMSSMANCYAAHRALSGEEQALSHCAKSNQQVR